VVKTITQPVQAAQAPGTKNISSNQYHAAWHDSLVLILQAVAIGSPHSFAAVAPHLLEFVRGPIVRGKKERLAAWLESKLEEARASSVSSSRFRHAL